MVSNRRRKSYKPCKSHQIRKTSKPRRCVNKTSPAGLRELQRRSMSPVRQRSMSPVRHYKPCKSHQIRKTSKPRRCVNKTSPIGRYELSLLDDEEKHVVDCASRIPGAISTTPGMMKMLVADIDGNGFEWLHFYKVLELNSLEAISQIYYVLYMWHIISKEMPKRKKTMIKYICTELEKIPLDVLNYLNIYAEKLEREDFGAYKDIYNAMTESVKMQVDDKIIKWLIYYTNLKD